MNPTSDAYNELQIAYDHYNAHLFGGGLPKCLITLQRDKRMMGYFSAARFVHRHEGSLTDEIAMNPSYFAVQSLVEVMQTLVHEMVHLWQFHFGKPSRRSYHNRQWAEKMEVVGLMPSDTGMPGGAKTGERMSDYPIAEGPFLKATEELAKSSFGISWLDRFPPESKGRNTMLALSEGRESWEPSEGESDEEAMPSPMEAAMRKPEMDSVLIQPQVRENRSNRSKYRCPVCETQVWGKPGLLIKCGNTDCDCADYEETS